MTYEFKFPDVGEGVHEGTIFQLKIKPGSIVKAGDILSVVETDKVVAEIPSPKDGVLIKYGGEEGDVIEVGQTLAYIELSDDEKKEVVKIAENANVVGELEVSSGAILASSEEGISDAISENSTSKESETKNKVLATPLARKLAKDKNIELAEVKGSGPAGRVTKRDILAFFDKDRGIHKISSTFSEGKIEKLSSLRKTVAKNMTISSQIPTATLHEEINLDELVNIKTKLKELDGEKLSYLSFISKAITIALKKYPIFNATYDSEKEEVHYHKAINLGIAVDSERGLMVPVINSCENLSVSEIGTQIKFFSEKVQANKITISDMRDGTITISNYGGFGGIYANPLILAPQVAIIGLGRIHQKPVVKNGEVVPGTVLPISIVIDHRVIDGAPAGRFISYLKQLLENPYKLLMKMV